MYDLLLPPDIKGLKFEFCKTEIETSRSFFGVFHAEPIKITNFRLGPIKKKVEQIHILGFRVKACQSLLLFRKIHF